MKKIIIGILVLLFVPVAIGGMIFLNRKGENIPPNKEVNKLFTVRIITNTNYEFIYDFYDNDTVKKSVNQESINAFENVNVSEIKEVLENMSDDSYMLSNRLSKEGLYYEYEGKEKFNYFQNVTEQLNDIFEEKNLKIKTLYGCTSAVTFENFMVEDSSKGGGMKGDNYICRDYDCEIIGNNETEPRMSKNPYALIYDKEYLLFNMYNSEIKTFNWKKEEIKNIEITEEYIKIDYKDTTKESLYYDYIKNEYLQM